MSVEGIQLYSVSLHGATETEVDSGRPTLTLCNTSLSHVDVTVFVRVICLCNVLSDPLWVISAT